VLALDGVFDLGLSAILDAFQTANELIEMTGLAIPKFEVKIVGMRRTVRTGHGLKVPVQLVGRETPEYVIVPAIACKTLDTLNAALATLQGKLAASRSAFSFWAYCSAVPNNVSVPVRSIKTDTESEWTWA
jgi:hypothetical protein